MRALTVIPGQSGSGRVRNVPEPPAEDGTVLVQTLAIGVCGTDKEILKGGYGWTPPGCDYLVLGHESLGRVLEAPAHSGLAAGDLVVGIVRRPDPVPCSNCGVGQLVFDAMTCTASGGIVCLAGLSSGERQLSVDAGALNRSMVLENEVVFGSVNANRRHYEAAAGALAAARAPWLERLITRRLPLDRWGEALQSDPKRDVKTVVEPGA